MSLIVGIVCFLAGGAAGALLFKHYRSDEAKVRSLETELQKLSEEHENYKSNVHTHFNNSARLLNEMTESYRSVYAHMANGARTLCPDYISSQLSLGNDRDLLGKQGGDGTIAMAGSAGGSEPAPPLDYATRNHPDQKGSLSEDYGIDKVGKSAAGHGPQDSYGTGTTAPPETEKHEDH